MIDARLVFLVLTGLMLAILAAISVATLRKNRKQKLEEPKYRMLKDD
ncbi:MAG: cbb3-type cytochrome c oxidase subunit 3 [Geobacteraceae bacterium]|nr:cbb3-type cytochrome c oxidase subunit 3 [Geobacteraceae bacterium]